MLESFKMFALMWRRCQFNIDSWKQKRHLLSVRFRLKVLKRGVCTPAGVNVGETINREFCKPPCMNDELRRLGR